MKGCIQLPINFLTCLDWLCLDFFAHAFLLLAQAEKSIAATKKEAIITLNFIVSVLFIKVLQRYAYPYCLPFLLLIFFPHSVSN